LAARSGVTYYVTFDWQRGVDTKLFRIVYWEEVSKILEICRRPVKLYL
jgi:hypothetical protein